MNLLEFAEESEYNEPSLELILPQMTWDNWLTSRNLDICKEYNEWEKGWLWFEWDKPFNLLYIEKKLISLMNARLISFQIQDIEWAKCKLIKNTVLGTYCSCTGRFKNTHGDIKLNKLQNKNLLNEHSDIKILLKLLNNIARIQSMKLLKSITDYKLTIV